MMSNALKALDAAVKATQSEAVGQLPAVSATSHSNHNAQSGWAVRCSALVRRFVRWKYVILTHRDYANRLNRSVEVENVLLACAAGKRDLSKDECRQLAVKLGVPECFRSPNSADASEGPERSTMKESPNTEGTDHELQPPSRGCLATCAVSALCWVLILYLIFR